MHSRHSYKSKSYKKDGIWLLVVVIFILIAGLGLHRFVEHVNHRELIEQERNNPQLQVAREQRAKEHRFIRNMATPAIKAYQRNYQVLPSVVLAQSIVESDWGSSKLYQVAHNPFGIKGKYHGKSITYQTVEYLHGKRITERAQFRRYPNLEAAIMDHDNALNRGFIHKNHVMSYVQDAKLLQANHYATDPHYASKLISVIKEYHLNKYDLEALN